jgi:hypothetical protein
MFVLSHFYHISLIQAKLKDKNIFKPSSQLLPKIKENHLAFYGLKVVTNMITKLLLVLMELVTQLSLL